MTEIKHKRPGPDVLYYYDQMFTLCYILHLLFTRQYVHDLKIHVTEQEKCSLRAKVHWLANRTAGWLSLLLGLCASEFRRNRKGHPGTYYEVAIARRAYSHFISQMSAHSLRELLCLPLSTRSWTRRLSLFPKGHSFQIVCRLIRRFLKG